MHFGFLCFSIQSCAYSLSKQRNNQLIRNAFWTDRCQFVWVQIIMKDFSTWKSMGFLQLQYKFLFSRMTINSYLFEFLPNPQNQPVVYSDLFTYLSNNRVQGFRKNLPDPFTKMTQIRRTGSFLAFIFVDQYLGK